MAYDVNIKRITRILKIGRKYLNWIQNSLFEGELTKAQFERLKADIQRIIDPQEDSVIFYTFRSTKYMDKQYLGLQKSDISSFI